MININKKYRTRDGKDVRIYATDGHETYPIHGAIMDQGWCPHHWMFDGLGAFERFDLVEVKPRIKQTLWINIYNNYQSISSTEKFAEDKADCGILARVKVDIDVEEGHGLT